MSHFEPYDRGSFPGNYAGISPPIFPEGGRSVKLLAYLHVVVKLRYVELYLYDPCTSPWISP